MKHLVNFFIITFLTVTNLQAQNALTNKKEKVDWFQNLGFGMFIHWNVDVTLGAVISHSLAGASDEYSE